MAETKLKTQSLQDQAVTQAKMAKVPIIGYQLATGGDWTSSSTTPVDVASLTLTLGSGMYTIMAFGTISVDGDTLNDNINSVIFIDGLQMPGVGSARANPTGSWTACPVFNIRTNRTGNVIVKLSFYRQAGSGTVTARNQHGSIMAVAFPE